MSKNAVEPEGPQVTSQCNACLISKATCSHARSYTQICSIYCFTTATVIRERASVLRNTYIACLVEFTVTRLSSLILIAENNFVKFKILILSPVLLLLHRASGGGRTAYSPLPFPNQLRQNVRLVLTYIYGMLY